MDRVLSIELAVYADALAGEAAALAARAERARSRLREAAIERAARADLPPATVARLEELGLLSADGGRARRDLRECDEALATLRELQAWVESRLAAADDDRLSAA